RAPDFGSVAGLLAAIRSPVIATQDTARRRLIERSQDDRAAVEEGLTDMFATGSPIERARALWVRYAIAGDSVAVAALKDIDPRIRELAVRILGRDERENGQVTYLKPEAKQPPPALKHLSALQGLANDPDAGVRRELILALRTLPTDQVGETLKT